MLEAYMKDGTPLDYTRPSRAGYIAAAALPHIPRTAFTWA
jgi:hypothetical protein